MTFTFNPLAPRGARREVDGSGVLYLDFNPLAPRGARRITIRNTTSRQIFQSTSSSRSQTPIRGNQRAPHGYFNPLAPRGARRISGQCFSSTFVDFNPLAPRGARHGAAFSERLWKQFQSTSSSRSQTTRLTTAFQTATNFNPLAPRGARLACGIVTL